MCGVCKARCGTAHATCEKENVCNISTESKVGIHHSAENSENVPFFALFRKNCKENARKINDLGVLGENPALNLRVFWRRYSVCAARRTEHERQDPAAAVFTFFRGGGAGGVQSCNY